MFTKKKGIPPHVAAAIEGTKASGSKSGAKGAKASGAKAREAAAMDAGMKADDGKAESQSEE